MISFEKYDIEIGHARELARDTIYKIILLSSGVFGFSVTLFTVFDDKIDFSLMKWSWRALLSAIVLGFITLFLHGRIKYAKVWKSTNTLYDEPMPYKYPWYYRIIVFPFSLFSVMIPANMVFNKPMSNGKFKKFKQAFNHYTVHELAWFEHHIPILENLVMLAFVAGLVLMLLSAT